MEESNPHFLGVGVTNYAAGKNKKRPTHPLIGHKADKVVEETHCERVAIGYWPKLRETNTILILDKDAEVSFLVLNSATPEC